MDLQQIKQERYNNSNTQACPVPLTLVDIQSESFTSTVRTKKKKKKKVIALFIDGVKLSTLKSQGGLWLNQPPLIHAFNSSRIPKQGTLNTFSYYSINARGSPDKPQVIN